MLVRACCWIAVFGLLAASVCGAEIPGELDAQLEQQARARLAWLRQQVAEQQREVRELEELLDESTQIFVQIRIVEVDAVEGRKAGLPIAGGDNTGTAVHPIPTTATHEPESPLIMDAQHAARLIDALIEQGHAKLLACPAGVTIDNREASLLSGGEFPILIPGEKDSVRAEFKEFGVRATVHPIILESGRVRLHFQASVSERDFANAVKLKDITIPGLTSRAVNSSVEMDFAKTCVLCGLTSTRRTAAATTVPVIGNVPYVNRMFKATSISAELSETAFVVLVTPSVVSRLSR
ncbi:MAG: hypothetical protein KF861_16885 [Planctomycetaceae bacterium]|nr:hypothetical protein [Planctomycetaceae bacterium]